MRIDFGGPGNRDTAAQVGCLVAELNRDRLPGVTDVVPAYSVVVVFYNPLQVPVTGAQLAAERVIEWVRERIGAPVTATKFLDREIVVPVCYGNEFGPDIDTVANRNHLSVEEVIRRHAQAVYKARAVGFSPGFPYLEGLPAELNTPRRATPRTVVPVGSVGIGGHQTGIYPLASPGGWNLIGRTPLRLFRPDSSPAALLRTGDTVRFRPIERAEFDELQRDSEAQSIRPIAPPTLDAVFEVISPGLQTTSQDLGRPGHQAEGVTPGGAMDALAARVANLLVGNQEGTPLLEAVQRGPKLRLLRDAVVAVTGANVKGIPGWRPLPLPKGQVVDYSPIAGGARVYVAVSGGLAADFALAGRGTDLRAAIGGHQGRPLASGDRLHLAGPPSRPANSHDCAAHQRASRVSGGSKPSRPADSRNHDVARWFVAPRNLVSHDKQGTLRILHGPQASWFSADQWQRLLSAKFAVTPSSNRMGIRLRGPSIELAMPREMTSEPVVHGALQAPPDGQPILLAADRQTIGGYPTIACVISVDLPLLGQLQPGAEIQFVEVSLSVAESLLREYEDNMAILAQAIQQHE